MMALAIILEKQFQEQFNMGEFSPLNIALAVGEEKSPGGWKMIFKASHRAGAESFLKTKSLHIRAFLIQSSIAFHIIKEQRVKYLPSAFVIISGNHAIHFLPHCALLYSSLAPNEADWRLSGLL